MSGYEEKLNAENMSSIYTEVVLSYREPISTFSCMCDFHDKVIKFPKWSFKLNFCSEFPGIFVPRAEINVTFRLFVFVAIKMLTIVLCANNS